jgi:hypothetical protein
VTFKALVGLVSVALAVLLPCSLIFFPDAWVVTVMIEGVKSLGFQKQAELVIVFVSVILAFAGVLLMAIGGQDQGRALFKNPDRR